MARQARNAKGELLEAAWQLQVEQLAAFYGWLVYHTHDSRRSAPGFPDLVMVRGAELLLVELKTDSGRLKPAQRDWLDALGVVEQAVTAAVDALKALGAPDVARPAVEAHVWRPAMFDDVVHPRLARGRHRQEPISL